MIVLFPTVNANVINVVIEKHGEITFVTTQLLDDPGLANSDLETYGETMKRW